MEEKLRVKEGDVENELRDKIGYEVFLGYANDLINISFHLIEFELFLSIVGVLGLFFGFYLVLFGF